MWMFVAHSVRVCWHNLFDRLPAKNLIFYKTFFRTTRGNTYQNNPVHTPYTLYRIYPSGKSIFSSKYCKLIADFRTWTRKLNTILFNYALNIAFIENITETFPTIDRFYDSCRWFFVQKSAVFTFECVFSAVFADKILFFCISVRMETLITQISALVSYSTFIA